MQRRATRLISALAAIALATAALSGSAAACTTFTLRTPHGTFFGKNYDFDIGDGMLVTNKRGVAKTAMLDGPGSTPASWVSRFGSLTFNQFGREAPSGGMNEAGLVVELMWLEASRYPARDARPAVGVLGWIEHMLDTCATVDDVVARSEKVRIDGDTPLHYLVADESGATATIEFLDGKLVVHRGERLVSPVLTNDTYESSVAYLRKHEGFGGAAKLGAAPSSLDRFCRAASRVAAYTTASGAPVDYAFGILSSVSQPRFTQWSIVYDVANRTVYYRTATRPEVKRVALQSFDFSCATPVKILDLDSKATGDVAKAFADYTREANRALVGRSFGGVEFLRNVPPAALDAISAYPDSTSCAAAASAARR